MKISGKYIIRGSDIPLNLSYKSINNVLDYNSSECIVIKYLNPDFSLILDNLSLIITEKGSKIAHLAILAMEQNKSIVLIPDIAEKIPKKGKITLSELKNNEVEIEIKK
ncbi:hypothetical protein JXB41_07475 [Candidatus Woesearchaeota archaeon]|nr:hypothetical protein [Candidatus Woesearchaeota archaeon]